MALDYKTSCEKCNTQLNMQSKACICSYECTFCETCSEEMNFICPNCNGELVKRPKRKKEN
ncbi:DUF1272 domain-containing protein [Flavobacterium urocaniciphilum]|uniref:RING-type domain-containing protein n=1 Tax=Flavobacterium urocaniciphilum TaxID=1299341 RepID=A0A1H8YTB9_9FLAO|nr:DUF1272 domain-containing protein [Flavobacterium urocaniciphilum]SEP55430.1 hypothetical protein SAMN05444005_101195 [Flavobacterium urocaniciphilum]